MTNSKELIDFIIEYENYVTKGNEILQSSFKMDKSPLLAKREGKIPAKGRLDNENLTFSFHGMGCRFEFGDIIVDFDYTFGDFIYKGFETSKLYWFIESCLGPDSEQISREGFEQSLKQLEDKGVITKIDESSYDTYDYVLNRKNL